VSSTTKHYFVMTRASFCCTKNWKNCIYF